MWNSHNVLISGHFDPFTDAHLDYLKQAMEFKKPIACIVSSDEQLLKKKGFSNIPEDDRAEIAELILAGLGANGRVFVNEYDDDKTIAQAIRAFKPNILFRGYDKTLKDMPENERLACEEMGVQIIHAKRRRDERHGSNFK